MAINSIKSDEAHAASDAEHLHADADSDAFVFKTINCASYASH
jgi:hypothetical protein